MGNKAGGACICQEEPGREQTRGGGGGGCVEHGVRALLLQGPEAPERGGTGQGSREK